VWAVARRQLRGSVRSSIVLVLVAGAAAAVAMSVWAAGRQSAGAVGRFVVEADAADVAVNVCPPGSDPTADPTPCFTYGAEEEQEALRELDHVEQVGLFHWRTLLGGVSDDPDSWVPLALADVDAGITSSTFLGEPIVVDGRMAAIDAPGEVVVREATAEAAGLHVGDQVWLEGLDAGPGARPFTSTVVGIVRTPLDLAPTGPTSFTGPAIFARAGWVEAHGDAAPGFGAVLAWLDDGDVEGFVSRAEERLDGPVIQTTPVFDPGELATAEQAVDFEGQAAVVTAAVAGIGALLLVAQTVSRQARAESQTVPTLRALGMTRAQRAAVAALRWAPVAVAAALVAGVVTVAASLHGPIGVARRGLWERDSIDPDGFVLIVGVLVVLLTVLVIAVGRASRRTGREPRGWRAGVLLPVRSPGVSVGLGLALRSLGRAALPLTSAVVATGLAIAAVITTASGAASLRTVVDDPARFGAPWDALVEIPPGTDLAEAGQRLAEVAGILDGGQIVGTDAVVGGEAGAWVQALLPVEGLDRSEPVIVEGRAPVAEDEIALGDLTRSVAGAEIGDTVVVESPTTGRSPTFEVVGLTMVTDGYEPNVGHGALVTAAGLHRIDPVDPVATSFGVRVADGPEGEQALSTLRRSYPGLREPFPVPASLANADRVRELPFALTLAAAVVAAVTFTHALVTAVGRERRTLAVCRVMGFTRRQVAEAVVTSATLLGLAAAVVGVVVGIAGARWGWRVIAQSFGVASGPVLTPSVLLAGAAAALLVANLAAAVPAAGAVRRRPAEALRVE
jgi:hypothetical protein